MRCGLLAATKHRAVCHEKRSVIANAAVSRERKADSQLQEMFPTHNRRLKANLSPLLSANINCESCPMVCFAPRVAVWGGLAFAWKRTFMATRNGCISAIPQANFNVSIKSLNGQSIACSQLEAALNVLDLVLDQIGLFQR